jgi:DNA-binding winged helix-turn-helix (wHTH) protein/TolB-like protein
LIEIIARMRGQAEIHYSRTVSRLTFGVFEFDPDSGELWRKGRPVRLQRQPARMLAALLATPGEVVSRESLQAAIWGSETHVDFDRGLNFCAAQIRTSLRDSSSQPQYVETVPRRGYRFIAPVRSGTAAAGAPAQAPQPTRRRAVSLRSAALSAVLVLLVGAAGWAVYRVVRPAPVSPPAIAVVPFENETGSPVFAQTAKNLSDATVARLASPERLSIVRVIGNASALRFTFVPRDLQSMGRSLDAEFIVLGQVKRDERRVRVVAHLIRVSDQTHVWAATYDRDTFDLPAQSDIAEAIAGEVVARTGARQAPHVTR